MKVQGAYGTCQSREVLGTAMSWKRAVSGSDMTAASTFNCILQNAAVIF